MLVRSINLLLLRKYFNSLVTLQLQLSLWFQWNLDGTWQMKSNVEASQQGFYNKRVLNGLKLFSLNSRNESLQWQQQNNNYNKIVMNWVTLTRWDSSMFFRRSIVCSCISLAFSHSWPCSSTKSSISFLKSLLGDFPKGNKYCVHVDASFISGILLPPATWPDSGGWTIISGMSFSITLLTHFLTFGCCSIFSLTFALLCRLLSPDRLVTLDKVCDFMSLFTWYLGVRLIAGMALLLFRALVFTTFLPLVQFLSFNVEDLFTTNLGCGNLEAAAVLGHLAKLYLAAFVRFSGSFVSTWVSLLLLSPDMQFFNFAALIFSRYCSLWYKEFFWRIELPDCKKIKQFVNFYFCVTNPFIY